MFLQLSIQHLFTDNEGYFSYRLTACHESMKISAIIPSCSSYVERLKEFAGTLISLTEYIGLTCNYEATLRCGWDFSLRTIGDIHIIHIGIIDEIELHTGCRGDIQFNLTSEECCELGNLISKFQSNPTKDLFWSTEFNLRRITIPDY